MTATESVCEFRVYWWDGEYEGECELPAGHAGDHTDRLSWWNDDYEDTTEAHREP